jgi:NAD(P) transhydrogenase subunit alpha
MIVGSIKEDINLEKRVSVTPETAKNIISLGLNINLEKNYAVHLGVDDKQYEENGVKFYNDAKEVINNSSLLLKVNCPTDEEIKVLKEKSILVGIFNPTKNLI